MINNYSYLFYESWVDVQSDWEAVLSDSYSYCKKEIKDPGLKIYREVGQLDKNGINQNLRLLLWCTIDTKSKNVKSDNIFCENI